VQKFSEAIAGSDTAAIGTKESFGCFTDEAVVFQLGVPSDDAARGLCAQRFRSVAT
jgi:hypothetical protein